MTSERWRNYTEKELARPFASFGNIPLFLTGPASRVVTLYVDPGTTPGARVTVGEMLLPAEATTEGVPVSLAGCPDKVPVRVKGELVGTLSGEPRAALISVEPNVCHVFEAVLYGDQHADDAPATVRNEGQRVWVMPNTPGRFLADADHTVKSTGTGTYRTLVSRVDCSR